MTEMPTWTYDTGTRKYRYWNGEAEITKAQYDRLEALWWKEKQAEDAKSTKRYAPFYKPPPDKDWGDLNGGRGMEGTQFVGKFPPGDPRNKRYFKKQTDMMEACRRENYTFERTR